MARPEYGSNRDPIFSRSRLGRAAHSVDTAGRPTAALSSFDGALEERRAAQLALQAASARLAAAQVALGYPQTDQMGRSLHADLGTLDRPGYGSLSASGAVSDGSVAPDGSPGRYDRAGRAYGRPHASRRSPSGERRREPARPARPRRRSRSSSPPGYAPSGPAAWRRSHSPDRTWVQPFHGAPPPRDRRRRRSHSPPRNVKPSDSGFAHDDTTKPVLRKLYAGFRALASQGVSAEALEAHRATMRQAAPTTVTSSFLDDGRQQPSDPMARYPVVALHVATAFDWPHWRHFARAAHTVKFVDASQVSDGPPLSEEWTCAVIPRHIDSHISFRDDRDVYLSDLHCLAVIPFLCSDIRANNLRVGLIDVDGILTPSTDPSANFHCPTSYGELNLWLSSRLNRFVSWVRAPFNTLNDDSTSVDPRVSISFGALKGLSQRFEHGVRVLVERRRWSFQICVGILNALPIACGIAPYYIAPHGRIVQRTRDHHRFWELGIHASAVGVDTCADPAAARPALSWNRAAGHAPSPPVVAANPPAVRAATATSHVYAGSPRPTDTPGASLDHGERGGGWRGGRGAGGSRGPPRDVDATVTGSHSYGSYQSSEHWRGRGGSASRDRGRGRGGRGGYYSHPGPNSAAGAPRPDSPSPAAAPARVAEVESRRRDDLQAARTQRDAGEPAPGATQ